MSEKEDLFRLLENFQKVSDLTNIKYIEIISVSEGKLEILCGKTYDLDFEHLGHVQITAEKKFTDEKTSPRIDYEILKEVKTVFCSIFPVFTGVSVTEYIITESDSKFTDASEKILACYIGGIKLYLEQLQTCDPKNNKYKIQLMKLREMQAKLFPSFQNIGDYDIKSAYLPADLMSGNFIDGFFINDQIYQIVVCDVGGYDATSSFTGATIRSIIRSHSSGKAIPSAIIESVTTKLSKLLKESINQINLTIFQLNISTGKIIISSYGSPNVLYFMSDKKTVTSLNSTPVGKQLSKKIIFKDFQIRILGNDSMLFFSNGVKNATSANGRELFGERNIYLEYVSCLNGNSLKITQNMIEKIYTFMDFAPLEEDIILLSIKKTRGSNTN